MEDEWTSAASRQQSTRVDANDVCLLCEMTFLGFAEPQEAMLDSYVEALKRGWSSNTVRDISAAELAEIERDPAAFIAARRDDAPLGTVTMADGRVVEKLPGRVRWIWDGDFSGAINLRWPADLRPLPPHVLGHVGYSVVPWKQGHGYARKALRHMLSEARDVGLTRLEITTDADNVASQKVVLANGGRFDKTFTSAHWGAHLRHLYVIDL